MIGTHKKQREKQFVDALIANLWPFTAIACEESESPDWLITFPNRVVGIEVTELPDPEFRPIEGREEKVIRMALRIATERGLPSAQVRIGFTRAESIPSKQVMPLAIALADCFERLYDPRSFVSHEVPMQSPLLPYIDLVCISSKSIEQGHDWRDLRANKIRELPDNKIQSALEEKEIKLPAYKAKHAECWLVIGVEGSYSSSAFRANSRAVTEKYKTGFDRVFYVNLTGIEVKELSVSAIV